MDNNRDAGRSDNSVGRRTSAVSGILTIRDSHDGDEREATELGPVESAGHYPRSTSISDPGRTPAPDEVRQPSANPTHAIGRFWRRYIQLEVPHVGCRDHLGMLRPAPDL